MESAVVFVCGELVIDLSAQTVTLRDEELALTILEFNTLAYLAQHQGRYVRAETLLEQVWGCETCGTPDQVKSCIKRLRHKLGPEGTAYLHTQWMRGYRLIDPNTFFQKFKCEGRS
jgi:DNA-binding response OmpR family regulator